MDLVFGGKGILAKKVFCRINTLEIFLKKSKHIFSRKLVIRIRIFNLCVWLVAFN